MKPWRPYWKALEAAIEHLCTFQKPQPFRKTSEIHDWILTLKYVELSCCDNDCKRLIEHLMHDDLKSFRSIFAGNSIHWQLILRCECALNFCQGRVEKRKDFDWNRPREEIFKFLLIDFWRSSALHWTTRVFPRPHPTLEERQASGERIANLQLLMKGNPQWN